MNDSNFSQSPYWEPSDERLNASFQTLSEIKQAFLTADPSTIADKLLVLMRQANSSTNTTLLDLSLMQALAIPDISVQMRVLSAVSLLIPSDSISLPFLPGFLKALLGVQELVPYVLRCIISILTPKVFENLKEALEKIAVEGSAISRRLCLIAFCKAYKMDHNNSKLLVEHINRALFDPEMRENAYTVISEVVESNPKIVEPLLTFLLPDLQDAKFISFTKLLRIFSFFTKDEAFASQLEGELMHLLEKNKQLIYLIEVARLLTKMESRVLLQEVQTRLDRAIPLNKNPNYALMLAEILVEFGPKITIGRAALHSLLTCQDYNVVSTALKLQGHPSVSEDIVKIVNDIVVEMTKTPSPHLAATAMQLVPHHGEWFVTIIFEIYNMHFEAAFDVLADAIVDVTDTTTQRFIIAEARKQMNELPDDRFGIAIAEMIARVSDDTEDFFVLLPSNIPYKSPEFQAAMIGCVFEFWKRLSFEVETSMMNRLMLMSFSNHREVRQRALELISMIKL